MDNRPKNKLFVVCGPTAVGKTSVGIKLAKVLNCSIISADSRQLYKRMSIGTAQPTTEELSEAPHYFIGNKSIEKPYTTGDFERESNNILFDLFRQNPNQLMVGGTGLYIKAVCEGLDDIPSASKEIRAHWVNMFEEKGIDFLQEKLKKVDIEFYNHVDIQNPRRLLRALEVFDATGKKYSSFLNKPKPKRNFETIKIGLELPREELYERINKRVLIMVEDGLIDEAKKLFPHRNLQALQTVGYTELFDHFLGNHSLERAIELIQQHSRNFAKRQMTWFRKDESIQWFSPKEIDNIEIFLNHSMQND